MTLFVIAAVAAVAGGPPFSPGVWPSTPVHAQGAQALVQPNIVFIYSDDQTLESGTRMPSFASGTDWIKFDNSFVNVSLCCPARAAIHSGRYSHHNLVESNQDPELMNDQATIANWLHGAGYRTGFMGKYFNGYPWNRGNSYIPPGWDSWAAYSGTSAGSFYYDFTLNVDGVPVSYGAAETDYSTDVFARRAKDFINAQTGPFFLMVATTGPHAPTRVAPRYANSPLPIFPAHQNYNEEDVSDKPAWVRALPLIGTADNFGGRGKEYRSVLAVDDLVKGVVDTLAAKGILDNTVIIYSSDNGLSFGNHRWSSDKMCAYEECSKVPLYIRYPGQPGRTVNSLAENVDIAPTLVELAGATATLPLDGRSLVPLLKNQPVNDWRTGLLLHWIGKTYTVAAGFWAIRTDNYKYVELNSGEKELYDLVADPYELQNQAGQPAYAAVQAVLAADLNRLRTTGASNLAPAADAQSVTTPEDTATGITLTGSDPEGAPLTYGVVTSPAHGALTGTAPNLTYTPNANYFGSDSFTFTVNDGLTTSAAATVSITVTSVNDPPTANAQSVIAPQGAGTPITLTGNDVEGAALSYSTTSPVHGALTGTAPDLTYTPTPGYLGGDSFAFTVNDGVTASAPATVSITVIPDNFPPTADAQSVTTAEDTATGITLTGTDPEGAPLSYIVDTSPAHGGLTGTAPTLTYTPGANYFGSDSFTFRVSDGVFTSAAATVSINVTSVNDPPTANAQSVIAPQGAGTPITLTGSDPEGDPLVGYAVFAPPAHGNMPPGTAPNLIYTPTPGYIGNDAFSFTVSDGVNTSAPGIVSITVLPPPVDAVFLTSGNVRKLVTGTTASFTAPANRLLLMWVNQSSTGGGAPTITDASRTWTLVQYRGISDNGIGLWQTKSAVATTGAVTISDALGTANNFAWSIVGYGATGVVQNASAASTTSGLSGLVSLGLPGTANSAVAAGFTMKRDVTPLFPGAGYSFSDAGPTSTIRLQPEFRPDFASTAGMSWSATSTWAGIAVELSALDPSAASNAAPTANAQSVTTLEDTAKSITLTGFDPEGSPLSYNVSPAPAHGALTGTAPTLTYTPNANYFGSDSFNFSVNDGVYTSAAATVSITVTSVNDPPTANAQSVTAPQGTGTPITLTGNDVEGAVLTYTVVTTPTHGALTGTAPSLTYTPTPGYLGGDSLDFTVNDGSATSAAATVSITVTGANAPPTADAQSVTTAEDTATGITLTGFDLEGAPLTYSVVTSPAHGALTGTAPGLTYTPAANYFGSDSFNFTVNDGLTTSAAATVSITVTSVNDPPTANAQSVVAIQAAPTNIPLTGNDVEGAALTYNLVTSPANGVLTGTAPTLTYTSSAVYLGPDQFTFTVSDGLATSAPATVSITVTLSTVDAAVLASGGVQKKQTINTASFTAPADRLLLLWLNQTNTASGVATVTDPARTWTLVEYRNLDQNGLSVWQSKSAVATTGAVTISYPAGTTNNFAWTIVGYGAAGVLQHASAASSTSGLSGLVTLGLPGTPNSAVAAGFSMRRDVTPLLPGAGYTFSNDGPISSIRLQAEFRPDFAATAGMAWTVATPWVGISVEVK